MRKAAGATMAELAREYDCGPATIWRALQPLIAAAARDAGLRAAIGAGP